MSSRKQQYAEKQARKAQFAVDKELESGGDNFLGADADVRDAAMGKGGKFPCTTQCVLTEFFSRHYAHSHAWYLNLTSHPVEEELFEKKLTKEEKKALAKKKRE